MAYSLAQMQSFLRQAGWPENLIATMAAIGMAESSGNPNAHNAVSPDDSYGLWQINMIGSLGPARRTRYGLSSNSGLYDPLTNAKVALDIYQQQGLRAWGPYVTGVYKKYLPASQTAYASGSSPASTSTSTAQAVIDASAGSAGNDYAGETNNNSLLLLIAAGVSAYLLLR
jgi:Lysozyme like domain